ncbi:MAG: putative 3-hydroxyphenylpropionic transporter MhpT [Methanomassiliicoccales archaeon PtaU1.Bin124]|nr:MAG: putative 3-hydroxyphenylpropionic transporter MhpT [Methanomassiliicoccales archaeon PtaU1.Bin124]
MKRRTIGTKVPSRVKWLILLTAFQAIGYGFLTTAISAYLPMLGVSSDQVGLIIGASGVAMILTAIPFGVLSDRIGRKRILLWSLVGVPPAMIICAISTDPSVFLIATIIAGISDGAFLSTWNAMIADQTNVDNRDMAFSLSFTVNGGFNAIGLALPLAFPLIEGAFGISSIAVHADTFLILGLITLISPVTIWYLLKDYKEKVPAPRMKGAYLRPRSRKNLMKFSINNMMIGLGAGLIIPLIPTWFYLEYGIGDTYTGPLLAAANLSIIFAVIFSTRLSHRVGAVKAIAITQASSTIFMVLIPFMPGAGPAAAVYLIRTALMNMGGPIMDSYFMGIVDKEDRGLASAINSIVWRLPNSATTVIGGLMLTSGYYTLPFILAATVYIIAVLAFYINFRNVKPNDEPTGTAL